MAKQLSAAFVNSVKDAGKYFDGGGLGLCLRVDDNCHKRWVQRIRINVPFVFQTRVRWAPYHAEKRLMADEGNGLNW